MNLKISLDGDFWRFCPDYDDLGITQQWMIQENQPFIEDKGRIAVPSCWNRKTAKDYQDLNAIGWYWRVFRIPTYFKERQVFLQIDGMAYHATVYINGDEIGQFHGGMIPFSFDISKFDQGMDLFLAIRIDARTSKIRTLIHGNKEKYYGLFGSVSLNSPESLSLEELSYSTKLHFEDSSQQIKFAEISFEVYLKNINTSDYKGEIVIELSRDYVSVVKVTRDVHVLQNNSRLSKIITHLMCENEDLWSPENPSLYNLSVSVRNDEGAIIEYSDVIGVREIQISNDSFHLNGKPYKLYGYDFEIDDPNFGYNIPHSLIIDKLNKLKEVNINAIRPNQGVFSPYIVELASRLGFLVFEDVPVIDLNLGEKNDFFRIYVNSLILQPSLAAWTINRETRISFETDGTVNKIVLDLEKLFSTKMDQTRLFITHPIPAQSWLMDTNEGLKDILKE